MMHFHLENLITERERMPLEVLRGQLERERRGDWPPIPNIRPCKCERGEQILAEREDEEAREGCR